MWNVVNEVDNEVNEVDNEVTKVDNVVYHIVLHIQRARRGILLVQQGV